MAMLEVKDLHVHYGVIEALKGISMSVNEGQIVALIGSNGAGKTTLLQSISAIKKKTSGEVIFHHVCDAEENRVGGTDAGAGGPPCVHGAVGIREPHDGGLPAKGQGGD